MRNGLSHSEAGKLGNLRSREKLIEYWKKKKGEYDNNPKRCKFCNTKIEYKRRRSFFCNRSCAASFNNINVNRHLRKEMEEHGLDIDKPKDIQHYVDNVKKQNTCLHCKKEIGNRGKFCSCRCQQDFNWIIKKNEITKRGNVNLNSVSNAPVARRYLRETRDSKCAICGITEWMSQKVPLVMDHINGNPSDWRLDNLRWVCGNCNMLLPTFAGRNRGHGRESRRKIYKKLGYC